MKKRSPKNAGHLKNNKNSSPEKTYKKGIEKMENGKRKV